MDRLTCPYVFTLFGAFLLITGTGLALFGVRRLNSARASRMVAIRNHSDSFNRWVRPNKTSSFKVYIFNVTNPNEVIAGWKPRLMSIGPYTYEIKTEKFDLYNSQNHLSYKLNNTVRFDPDSSGHGSEYDEITILNIPLIAAYTWKNGKGSELTRFPAGFFIKATVKELLFDGIPIDCSRDNKSREVVPCEDLENWPSPLIRRESERFKFSFFHQTDGVSPETYTVNSGNENVEKTGEITAINDSNFSNIWKVGSHCDIINGSDGTQFPMPLNRTKKLFLYDKNLCRSIYIEFERVIHPKELELFRYIIKKNLLASKEDDSNNECFCRSSFNIRSGNCYKTGFFPLFSCKGPALVASWPHFYLADDDYYGYEILKPSKRFHQTYFDIEPNYGVTILSCKRIQINLDIRKVTAFNTGTAEGAWFKLSDQIFPILWTEEKTGITEEYYEEIRYGIIQKKILENGSASTIVLGAIVVGLSYPGWYILRKMKLVVCDWFARLSRKRVVSEEETDLDDTWESQTRRIKQMKKMAEAREGRITCQLGAYFKNLENRGGKNVNPPKIDNFM